jgi:predicted N-acyltransferase/Leu/Phe-tRNA-protein transferase
MQASVMQLRIHASLEEISPAAWDALHDRCNPFVSHAFLVGLERTGCLRPRWGWTPKHAALYQGDDLVAAAPGYRKDNSHGEFVFDHAWAAAFARHGRDYYPKWLVGVPYSPVPGPRLLARDAAARRALSAALADTCRASGHSSIHVNFCQEEDAASCDSRWLARNDLQFHWSNPGWSDFDEFLAALTHKRRKAIRQEREKVRRAGYTFRIVHGDEASEEDLAAMHAFYCLTFAEKGNSPALTLEFFRHLATAMPQALVLVLAERTIRAAMKEVVAGALCLRGADTLYGRYWGSEENDARPALRDLLLPGHRVLPAPTACAASNPAHRANTSWRAASCRSPRTAGTSSRTRTLPMPLRPGASTNAANREYYGPPARAFAIPGEERLRRDACACRSAHPTRTHLSLRWTGRCTSPTACLRWAATCIHARLLNAYRHGIFPWYSRRRPILWWSPDPRVVFETPSLHLGAPLPPHLRSPWQATADGPLSRPWSRPAPARHARPVGHLDHARDARGLRRLHRTRDTRIRSRSGTAIAWWAASTASPRQSVFCGESMFSAVSGGSKLALALLCRFLAEGGIDLLDAQVPNPHLALLGAKTLARSDYLQRLARPTPRGAGPGPWSACFGSRGVAELA